MSKPANRDTEGGWDVVVVGGGMGGIAAAISAAHRGAKTLLVERSDVLGGNATQAFVHTFCGLFLPPSEGTFAYANPGFAERLSRWLMERGGASAPEVHGKVGVLPTYPVKLVHLLHEACEAVPHLELAMSTRLVEATVLDDKSGFCLKLESSTGRRAGRCEFLIDTSGDGHAAAAAGALFEISPPDELQHPTFVFKVSGANPKDLEGYARLKLAAALNRGARSGELPSECDSVLFRPTGVAGESYISLNMPKPSKEVYNPLDDSSLQELESVAKRRAAELVRFLRISVKGWEACEVLEWPRRLGVRETRRISGTYVMTKEDILSGRQFADQVAVSTWPIELWNNHTGADFEYPSAPCQIPLGALISVSNARIGMAGRCMSATHEALGALRVMGTAMAAGEAIGLAAALASDRKVTLADISSDDVRQARAAVQAQRGRQP